ncbi:hypothetical protein SCP_1502250 [Sparassis crispa]|uniref:Uncharacterized protein n=1 Tax=Sparassis crispa TaxID=139825 RepID=A0A401H455_9APHY|nr:hypothetical protein SCP_1502250 [Sparassis crispa]GBE89217.1 hypothetical protein SCP_1502250 [Sparassis crispa]
MSWILPQEGDGGGRAQRPTELPPSRNGQTAPTSPGAEVPASPWGEFPKDDKYPKVPDAVERDRLVSMKQANRPFLGHSQCRKQQEKEHEDWVKHKKEREDFVVIGSTLYTVWDKQGQSMVEYAKISFHDGNRIEVVWNTATYAHEAELIPAYLEELLLPAGSMADKFFEAISRPGIFSPVTLRTVIDQYTDACRPLYTPQLLTTYGSVGEQIAAIVGCTVELTRDHSTARCREIEHHARWPLAIGMGEPREGILVVERELIAALVDEDFPLGSRRLLAASSPLDPQFTLLEILWTLRAKIGTGPKLVFEDRLVDLPSNIREELDEGMESWIAGRLQSIENMSDSIQSVLDVIGGLEKNVKKEDEDGDAALRLPPAYPEWWRALVSSYVAISVQTRYDSSEIFLVFRGIAMLRYATRQPAVDSVSTPAAEPLADEEVARMRDLHVSSTASGFTPSYSLIHRLLMQYDSDAAGVPASAHLFLDSSGLLESLSPTNATKLEVLFCERLRLLGYREASRESLAWLPRIAGVTTVLGRLVG